VQNHSEHQSTCNLWFTVKVLTISFGCGNTRLPVDGLTEELSLVSDASDSMESAELIVHRRLTNGLLSEPATDECTKQIVQHEVTSVSALPKLY